MGYTREQMEYIACTRINFNDLLWAIKYVGLEKVLEDARKAFGDNEPESSMAKWGYVLRSLEISTELLGEGKI